jgi:hypothetical protein
MERRRDWRAEESCQFLVPRGALASSPHKSLVDVQPDVQLISVVFREGRAQVRFMHELGQLAAAGGYIENEREAMPELHEAVRQLNLRGDLVVRVCVDLEQHPPTPGKRAHACYVRSVTVALLRPDCRYRTFYAGLEVHQNHSWHVLMTTMFASLESDRFALWREVHTSNRALFAFVGARDGWAGGFVRRDGDRACLWRVWEFLRL